MTDDLRARAHAAMRRAGELGSCGIPACALGEGICGILCREIVAALQAVREAALEEVIDKMTELGHGHAARKAIRALAPKGEQAATDSPRAGAEPHNQPGVHGADAGRPNRRFDSADGGEQCCGLPMRARARFVSGTEWICTLSCGLKKYVPEAPPPTHEAQTPETTDLPEFVQCRRCGAEYRPAIPLCCPWCGSVSWREPKAKPAKCGTCDRPMVRWTGAPGTHPNLTDMHAGLGCCEDPEMGWSYCSKTMHLGTGKEAP